jgi:hypothetical protein
MQGSECGGADDTAKATFVANFRCEELVEFSYTIISLPVLYFPSY